MAVEDEHPDVVEQVDSLRIPRYAGFTTFARLPRIDDVPDHAVAVLGIPFDSGVTYRPGARFGPAYIRQASRLLRPWNQELEVAPFRAAQVVDAGDVAASPFSIDDALATIEDDVRRVTADGRRVVVLGGDHTVALPVLRALSAQHGPLALVHFDAHLDTWDTYFGAPYTHGTPFRRAAEEGLLLRDRSAHVGIRGRDERAVALGEPAAAAQRDPAGGVDGGREAVGQRRRGDEVDAAQDRVGLVGVAARALGPREAREHLHEQVLLLTLGLLERRERLPVGDHRARGRAQRGAQPEPAAGQRACASERIARPEDLERAGERLVGGLQVAAPGLHVGELEQELGVVGADVDRFAQEGGGLGERGHAARLGRRGGEMRHGVRVAARQP